MFRNKHHGKPSKSQNKKIKLFIFYFIDTKTMVQKDTEICFLSPVYSRPDTINSKLC